MIFILVPLIFYPGLALTVARGEMIIIYLVPGIILYIPVRARAHSLIVRAHVRTYIRNYTRELKLHRESTDSLIMQVYT